MPKKIREHFKNHSSLVIRFWISFKQNAKCLDHPIRSGEVGFKVLSVFAAFMPDLSLLLGLEIVKKCVVAETNFCVQL